MYQNRTTNRKINRLRERCLRIIYNDKQSSFKILLEKDSSVSIQKIVTFTICDLILFYRTESISYLGLVIWDILPDSYKNVPNFSVFKNKIVKQKPENCPCRLSKRHISRVVFT